MILVTGATGNIGRELSRDLDARGVRFRMLVRDTARTAGLPERADRVVGGVQAHARRYCGVPHRRRATATRPHAADICRLAPTQRRPVSTASSHMIDVRPVLHSKSYFSRPTRD
jgi:nucleoside-diphosphate-sugar epimerase